MFFEDDDIYDLKLLIMKFLALLSFGLPQNCIWYLCENDFDFWHAMFLLSASDHPRGVDQIRLP